MKNLANEEYLDSRSDSDITTFSHLLADKDNLRRLHHLLLVDDENVFARAYRPTLPFLQLLDLLPLLPKWLRTIQSLPHSRYQFSNILEQWIKAHQAYPIETDSRLSQTCIKPRAFRYPSINSYLCIFLTQLHYNLISPAYQHRAYHDKLESEKNYSEYADYINQLFECYSRLVVVRLDFGYKKGNDDEPTFEEVKQHLSILHNNARRNRLFEALEGYITKIEYGLDKKVHVHAFFFFNGHKRLGSSDVYLAQKIGEYWEHRVTKGKGNYWNCNANKKKYRHVGIGLVQASDATIRDNLIRWTLMYLCKKETQAIKPRNQPQAKNLTRGDLRNKPFNLGRPRT